jgi:hypothetical protein
VRYSVYDYIRHVHEGETQRLGGVGERKRPREYPMDNLENVGVGDDAAILFLERSFVVERGEPVAGHRGGVPSSAAGQGGR